MLTQLLHASVSQCFPLAHIARLNNGCQTKNRKIQRSLSSAQNQWSCHRRISSFSPGVFLWPHWCQLGETEISGFPRFRVAFFGRVSSDIRSALGGGGRRASKHASVKGVTNCVNISEHVQISKWMKCQEMSGNESHSLQNWFDIFP